MFFGSNEEDNDKDEDGYVEYHEDEDRQVEQVEKFVALPADEADLVPNHRIEI